VRARCQAAQLAQLGLLVASMLALGCGGDDSGGGDGDGDADACLEPLPRDCAIIWTDYETMHTRLFGATCGASSTAGGCHAAEGAMGGLVLEDVDLAHDALLSPGSNGQPRIIPGDPECSKLVKRLYSDEPGYQMPPGGRLKDNELCSIVRWIADGAERGDLGIDADSDAGM